MMAAARLTFLLALVACAVCEETTHRCERLKLKTPSKYTQDKAPKDISGVLPIVVEKVNRELEGVLDVEVEWEGGDLHGKVGEHTVQCKVTRLASAVQEEHLHKDDKISTDDEGREVIVQCFLVPFTILDTDECTLPSGHSMRHKCHAPSVCVNTIGSYECLCPRLDEPTKKRIAVADDKFWAEIESQERSAWEVSLNSTDVSSCPSSASTHGCCPPFAHTGYGSECRANFRCPVDSCRSSHDCAPNAKCELEATPRKRPNFRCKCPPGLMGSGHACRPGIDAKPEPKVMFDGVTPTEETIKRNYCGCTTPVVDACAGFPPCKGKNEICRVTARNEPKCACKDGYVYTDEYGCVDETPPLMRLRHDPDGNRTLRLRQGDVYKEYAVDIMDENAEDYLRSLRISYSKPLPPGCLTSIGEFHVNYTVATPWTSPPYVRVTRKVVIDDIDECTLDVSKYESSCPDIIPQCDVKAGATCVNTIGSYTCRCPEYTAGDGFKPIHTTSMEKVPEGYKGGNGCVDTSLPVIDIVGPNPKVFKVCKCGGLKGVMGGQSGGGNGDQLCREHRKRYESGLRELILSTDGAELCATHRNPHPSPSECVKALDKTFKGPVDLSSRVVVGEPIQKSPLHWTVSYNVMDDAGNAAKTVWRDIIVEEVDLFDVEKKVRAEMTAEREEEVKEAVKKAVEKDRARRQQVEVVGGTDPKRRPRGSAQECPACPECKCPPSDKKFDPKQCDKYCEKIMAKSGNTCTPNDSPPPSSFLGPIQFFHEWLPPWAIKIVYWVFATVILIYFLRSCLTAIFNPRAHDTYTFADDRELQNAVNYYSSPPPAQQSRGLSPAATLPQRPMSAAANGDLNFFSPPQDNRGYPVQERPQNGASPFWTPGSNRGMQSPATPSRQWGAYDDSIYQDTPLRRRR